MGIFRAVYYSNVVVGSGWRITIPQEMRDDLKLEEGDTLTARLEEDQLGHRQLTLWKRARE